MEKTQIKLNKSRIHCLVRNWFVFSPFSLRNCELANLQLINFQRNKKQQKEGWSYKGEISYQEFWEGKPHGKGKLFQRRRLIFKGRFYKGRIAVWDLVRQVKDDKKVLEYVNKLGGGHFSPNAILSMCERGGVSDLYCLFCAHSPFLVLFKKKRNAKEEKMKKWRKEDWVMLANYTLYFEHPS